MEDLFTILNIIDWFTLLGFIICTVYAWKTAFTLPSKFSIFLFVGFFISALIQIGFIIVDIIPFEENLLVQKTIAEISVGSRIIPSLFLTLGMVSLYREINKYLK